MGERLIPDCLGLKAGEWVEVRSKSEVLATLDKNGRLDELPFMPQMLSYCGRKLRVRKRAHKVCDTAYGTGARSLSNAAILEDVRCDGQAFGGCELKCTIIWKEAWLKRVDGIETISGSTQNGFPHRGTSVHESAKCSEADIWAGTRLKPEGIGNAEPLYVCQAVQLPHATRPLSRWDLRQYVEDYASGNARISEILSSFLILIIHDLAESGLGFGSALRWAYNIFQKIRGGMPYPFRRGLVSAKSRTPSINLNIQVGELVQIKPYDKILETVNEQLNNRGMTFHPEMAIHCGETFRVSQRLSKMMNEKTGQLVVLKNECLVLEGMECIGLYAKPIYCPRACYPYWREIWLERADKLRGQSAANQTIGSPTETDISRHIG
jgi:hypothetical protein